MIATVYEVTTQTVWDKMLIDGIGMLMKPIFWLIYATPLWVWPVLVAGLFGLYYYVSRRY